MGALIALVKREYLEHRGAFVFGPVILIGLLLLAAAYMALGTDVASSFGEDMASALKVYETMAAVGAAAWLVYLMVMLFFYYGDAFSADSRNNSMLFWKSMPQSDLKILGSKVAASLSVFPAAILLAAAITGVIAYLPTMMMGDLLPGFAAPGPGETARAWVQIMISALGLFVLTLLWFLPYLAWVGLCSTIFRRWAIPIAFLIPAVIGLAERVVLRERFFEAGPIWTFISERFQLQFEGLDFETYWMTTPRWDGFELVALMLNGTDWVSLFGGLVVAGAFVFAASEYRRRYVLA